MSLKALLLLLVNALHADLVFCSNGSVPTLSFKTEIESLHENDDFLIPQLSAKSSANEQQLVETVNRQLATVRNGAQILVLYLGDALEYASLNELIEELTFLSDAYLKPALLEIDPLAGNLLQLLSRIANERTRVKRLFAALDEHLEKYFTVLRTIHSKYVAATNGTSKIEQFINTEIALEGAVQYPFKLIDLYVKLLQSATVKASSEDIATLPLANIKHIVDCLGGLLPDIRQLSTKPVGQKYSAKFVNTFASTLESVKSSLVNGKSKFEGKATSDLNSTLDFIKSQLNSIGNFN